MPTKKITYKNHCTPQEQVSAGGRYYHDSDCGRKLTGNYTFTLNGDTTSYASSSSVTETPSLIATLQDFIFIKNIGDNDVLVSLDNNESYKIKLSKNESFAAELSYTISDLIYVKTGTGLTSTIEYLRAT